MTTTTPAPVEVTAEDREAAADAVRAYRDQKNNDWQARIRRGECDDGYMVQAFAAHRIAAPSARPVQADLVEADVDWRVVARLAGEHGIRYRTNKALVQFLNALTRATGDGA